MKEIVYFVKCKGSPYVKIGKTSTSVNNRIKSFQTGNPFELQCVKTTEEFSESEMHTFFSDYHYRGEWFTYEGSLKDYIEGRVTLNREQKQSVSNPIVDANRRYVEQQSKMWIHCTFPHSIQYDYSYFHKSEPLDGTYAAYIKYITSPTDIDPDKVPDD